jgi:hypothetical protein
MFSKKKPNYKLSLSTRKDKKYMVINPEGKRIHFGAKNHGDYIIWNKLRAPFAEQKKINYIKRHSKLNEDWSKSGIDTPGFWSRWLLWNEKTWPKSINFIEKKFNINIY